METEEEQVERIKAWLKENGMSIVLGIVIGVGGIVGYNFWVKYQDDQASSASNHYSRMMEALAQENSELLQQHADVLTAEYSGTDYAFLAYLALAKRHVDVGEFEKAEAALQQVVGSAAQQPLGYIARTRLAAVQMQSEKFDQALASLSTEFPAEFTAIAEELRGDIYVVQGNSAAAIESYRKAQSASPGPADTRYLQQKLSDLGDNG